MRITGGQFKGRRIIVPGGNVRPSTDKLREAIFSIIGGDIMGASVADLFCGSGALGVEALSRGANRAIFIDSSRGNMATLKRNLENLKIGTAADVKTMDVMRIRPAMLEDISIIFADPPYNLGLGDRLISLLCLPKFKWCGILVLEHESSWEYTGEEMEVLNRKVYGDAAVTFLKLKR